MINEFDYKEIYEEDSGFRLHFEEPGFDTVC